MSNARVFNKCVWRLIPFMMLLYLVNYIDRVNVGFAALTMNHDLGFSPSIYGFGAGIFVFSYALFQLPANIWIERVGARRGMFVVLMAWGLISAANAFVWSPASFYVLRFSLGVAEAGFFPGMILYMTCWFPKAYFARCIGIFQAANPLAFVLGGPLSSLILGMDGVWSLHGWQWLFLFEGLPACLLAFVAYRILADGPALAPWLSDDEKAIVLSRLAVEGATAHRNVGLALRDWRVFGLGLAGAGIQFCASGIQFWVPQIVQGKGFSNGIVGFIVALPFLFGTVAMILWGYSSDLRGERIWHIALAALFSAVGLIVASISESAFVMLAGLTAAIAGLFSTLPVINSIPPSFLRGPAAAGGIALFNMIAQFGGFFGPVVMGVLKQNTGGYAAGLLSLALAISLSALFVLGLGRAMSLRPAATAVSV